MNSFGHYNRVLTSVSLTGDLHEKGLGPLL